MRLTTNYRPLKVKLPKWAPPAYQLATPSHDSPKRGRRYLFVIEHIPSEDLKSGKLLGGSSGELFATLVRKAAAMAGIDFGSLSWRVEPFNLCKTYDLPDSERAQLEDIFIERLRTSIAEYEPDGVIVFGYQSFWMLMNGSSNPRLQTNFYGQPMPLLNSKGVKITCTLPLYRFLEDKDGGQLAANLLGYCCRNIANGLLLKNPYRLILPNLNIQVVDTLSKFDGMLSTLDSRKHWALDTETNGLGRVSNRMLTLQIGDDKVQFFVPFLHRENPWSGSKLETIKTRLANWFEFKGGKYHVMHNGQFDIPVVRNNTGARYYRTPVWDTMHGEYVLDENLVYLKKGKYPVGPRHSDKGYYGLENILAQYGSHPYNKLKFQKDDRATIENRSLSTPDLIPYACLDVLAPFVLHLMQRQRAEDMKYTRFLQVMLYQESDKVHSFAAMGLNGIPADIPYLMKLPLPDSVVSRAINESESKIYLTKAARRLNRKLLVEEGLPATGLWGENRVLNIKDQKHRRRLLVDELGLEPLDYGAKGDASINKAFKEKYKDVEEVALLSAFEKGIKLRDSFVNSFLAVHKSGGDIAIDNRIRPSFNAVNVVTGRIAEFDPNMQQVPTHGSLAYAIKRIFASHPGHIFAKVDYVSHEVRGWALVANDKVLGEVFAHGLDLRVQYMHNPSKELAELIFLEGDVHRLNVVYFFKVDLSKLDPAKLKKLRNDIKGVVFGLIYGKGIPSLVNDLKLTEREVESLVDRLFKRFFAGAKWLRQQEEFARTRLYVESPIGRRRNLWHSLIPQSSPKARSLYGAANRRARNSPIQGVCSDFNFIAVRALEQRTWERTQATGRVGLETLNVVHDSQENNLRYEDFWWGIKSIKECMTDEVQRRCAERFKFDFIVPLEIDMEVGPDLANLFKWDWSLKSLAEGVAATLLIQQHRGHDISPVKTFSRLFERDYGEAPDFIRKQLKRHPLPAAKAFIAEVRNSDLFKKAYL